MSTISHHKNNTAKKAWHALKNYRLSNKNESINNLFASNPQRFNEFSLTNNDLLLDFSKTTLTKDALTLLLNLAKITEVEEKRQQMLDGDIVNHSEQRAAWHTALRYLPQLSHLSDKTSPINDVLKTRDAFLNFAEDCRNNVYTTENGKPFQDIVNIGIGGSCIGPAMAINALKPYHNGPRIHFVSNMDGADLTDTLKKLKAEHTLFIVSSKTFTTLETLSNATIAREWLKKHLGTKNYQKHMIAVTASSYHAKKFGIEHIFLYWEWVGGRFSLWSAVGLPLAIAIGKHTFTQFLAGAHDMDTHFSTAPLIQNMPVLLALIGVWHRSICHYPTRMIIPYDERLAILPTYLQQLDMESNGKHIKRDGRHVTIMTAPIVWGAVGTNAQHSYFQLLHQGTDVVPCEFFVAAIANQTNEEQHQWLVANCLAQSKTLMDGHTTTNPHSRLIGNRPSITLMYKQLTPYTLGQLLAMFEHRTFVEGTLWEINPFDQWGVEFGKEVAKQIYPLLDNDNSTTSHDSSTQGLIQQFKQLSQKNNLTKKQ